MEKVGTLTLNKTVDITDPCYDRSVWCRMTEPCMPGEYTGYVDIFDEGEWGERVASISIYKDDKAVPLSQMHYIGEIGVDAGLAGFFNNKRNFNDEEWTQFCSEIEEGNAWCLYDGIFSSSGYGDGGYSVYANDERSAFTIVFIGDEEEEDEEEW